MRLEGLGSAGYDWSATVQGPRDVIRWSLEPAYEASDAAAPPGGLPPDNISPEMMLIITALRPGRVRLILIHRRPWEAGKPPRREISLDLQILG